MVKVLRPVLAINRAVAQSSLPPIHSRRFHESHGRLVEVAAYASPTERTSITTPLPHSQQPSSPPLCLLPTHSLIRSYFINLVSSNRFLLNPSMRILSLLAHSDSAFLNPDRNGILRYLLKKTFYAQFCGGESKKEIQATVNGLKKIGFAGVVLAYAKEIVVHGGHDISMLDKLDNATVERDVNAWKEGNLKTIEHTSSADFIGLKFSGAGMHAVQLLAAERPRSPILDRATSEICEFARTRNVRLLFDAEQQQVQKGIDSWTLDFMKKYNQDVPGKAVVYGTYQSYLRSTPATVAEHLAIAKAEGFTLGVKLVRGAYLASDPRHLFWSNKEETDRTYDGIAEALIKQQYNDILKSIAPKQDFPDVALMLASHNQATVKKAMSLRRQQTEKGERKIDMVYGQLMGMADEVSCELVMARKQLQASEVEGKAKTEGPRTFKYLVWGSVGECTKYLLRRAEENRDAVLRAKESRNALWKELSRRVLARKVRT